MTKDFQQATQQTIADFGNQWTTYTENEGYYASQGMLLDILGPLLDANDLQGKRCAEVGAGTGRISAMLLSAGAGHVTAIEPSKAKTVLERNLASFQERVTILAEAGHTFEIKDIDYIFSIGVLHHIPDPASTVEKMHGALKPGGKAIVWLYGREGNFAYLAVVEPLRWVTRKLPVWMNSALAAIMYPPLAAYIALCRFLPLPMRHYMRNVLKPIGGKAIRLVIVDQLNPRWAKYYTEVEARALLEKAGFVDVRLYHRHGYSWTVIGTK
ncbi:SAM-dependent methyltransferase [Shinella sumterensis]|uniref:class I SAM-dependent methyltransferase n=1 Tax=Shinella sumterensis TaxID=1967501 RepID=UPI00106DE1F2|nr:class I SAM-dependent methyltransferase [Shinella sumterensis]MCD1266819.1 methyltransferase domain-containing protein [Shinella sumterensis]TFE95320.1 SAM-dependent methyltransferase [Shinella sumterensis]